VKESLLSISEKIVPIITILVIAIFGFSILKSETDQNTKNLTILLQKIDNHQDQINTSKTLISNLTSNLNAISKKALEDKANSNMYIDITNKRQRDVISNMGKERQEDLRYNQKERQYQKQDNNKNLDRLSASITELKAEISYLQGELAHCKP